MMDVVKQRKKVCGVASVRMILHRDQTHFETADDVAVVVHSLLGFVNVYREVDKRA